MSVDPSVLGLPWGVAALPMLHKQMVPLVVVVLPGLSTPTSPSQQVPVPRAVRWRQPKAQVMAVCLAIPSPLQHTLRIFIKTRARKKGRLGPLKNCKQQGASAQSLSLSPPPAAGFDQNNLQRIRDDLPLILPQLEQTKGDSASRQNVS